MSLTLLIVLFFITTAFVASTVYVTDVFVLSWSSSDFVSGLPLIVMVLPFMDKTVPETYGLIIPLSFSFSPFSPRLSLLLKRIILPCENSFVSANAGKATAKLAKLARTKPVETYFLIFILF